MFRITPMAENWEATRHKDLTRKTSDFLWKSTQNAYKIGATGTPSRDSNRDGSTRRIRVTPRWTAPLNQEK